MKALNLGLLTTRTQCHKQREQMFIARVGLHGARGLGAIVEQGGYVASLQAIRHPVGELAHIRWHMRWRLPAIARR